MNSILTIFATCLIGYVLGSTELISDPVERPLRIGAFNVQKLGNSKFGNKKVIDTVKKILLRFDLILIQEIVTTDEDLMKNLVNDLNKKQRKGARYEMTISERLGRGSAKEQYAYLYRYDKVRLIHAHAFPDKADEFMRPPYIAHFSTPTLRDTTSVIFIGIHTQPRNASNETSSLANVYDYAKEYYNHENAILMGDMNIGCGNVRISDWNNIQLWKRSEFTWLIGHNTDTTVSTTCCPYDRIIIAGETLSDAIVWNKIRVFNFREEYGLTDEEALEVSDHWPVEVVLRAKVSEVVSKHIVARVCISVDDNRKFDIPEEIQKQKSTMGFVIEKFNGQFINMYNTGLDSESVLTNLEKLQKKYPNFISPEIFGTVSYKVQNGVLDDESSHDEPIGDAMYSVLIELSDTEETLTIHFCTETTPN